MTARSPATLLWMFFLTLGFGMGCSPERSEEIPLEQPGDDNGGPDSTYISQLIVLSTLSPAQYDTAGIYTYHYDDLGRMTRKDFRNYYNNQPTSLKTTEWYYAGNSNVDSLPVRSVVSIFETNTVTPDNLVKSWYKYEDGLLTYDSSVESGYTDEIRVLEHRDLGFGEFQQVWRYYNLFTHEFRSTSTNDGIYEWQDGNVLYCAKIVDQSGTREKVEKTYTYDSRPNPLQRVELPSQADHFMLESFGQQSRNNIVSYDFSVSSNQNVSFHDFYEYQYEYRADRYPLKATETNGSGEVYVYIYLP